jgi:hypothetical protein
LHNVDEVTRLRSIHSIKGVAKTLERKARRIELEEDLIQNPTTPKGSDAKNDIEHNTRTVTDTGEDKSRRETGLASFNNDVLDINM